MSEQKGIDQPMGGVDEKQDEAWRIYIELRSLAFHPGFTIVLSHRGVHVDFREGEIKSLDAYFEREPGVSFYRRHYGFSEKRIRAGLIHILEYRYSQQEGIYDKKSIVVSLWPGRMVAKNREVPHEGEIITLEPIELNVLNAFFLLSLAVLYIQEHFGDPLGFMRLLGADIDRQGIDVPLFKNGQEAGPLFAGGLTQFHLNYLYNRENARDNLDAFRAYLEKAGMTSLTTPLLLSERSEQRK